MTELSPHLQRLTDGLPADKRADIEEAITTSPYLQQRMTQAIETGQLEHIRLTAPGANEGGHYDSREKAIYISVDTFTKPGLEEPRDRIDVITSTLGHETGHALNAAESRKTLYFVTAQVTEEMRTVGPGGSADVTPYFALHQRAARRDEAIAEIEGWNALASRIQHTNGGEISRTEMLRRAIPTTECVKLDDKYVPQLAPGIVLDENMHMVDTRLPKAGAINVEPVAQCHFDQSPRSLGAQGKADYRNYYGAYLIEQISQDTAAWVNPPLIRLDMARLGLDPAQLESTGLNLGGKDLGLVDTGHEHQLITLQHTEDGRKHTPDDIVRQPPEHDAGPPSMPRRTDNDGVGHVVASAPQDDLGHADQGLRGTDEPSHLLDRNPGLPTPATFSYPGHPQHALYSTIKTHLPDYTSENRLSQFTTECHLAGITARSLASIHVEGERVTFSTQWGWPRAEVGMGRGSPPAQESVRRAEVHDQNTQELALLMRAEQPQQAPAMAR